MRIKKQKNTKKILVIAIIFLILASLAGVLLYKFIDNKQAQQREQQYGSKDTRPSEDVTKKTDTPTKNDDAKSNAIGSSKTESGSASQIPQLSSDVTPKTPVGTFVSNHRPNLSGHPAPNTLNSSCTTTPGAKCTIEFTNGSITKRLPEKATDENGNIDWDWSLDDIGIAQGKWSVRALAINGDKSSYTDDPIDLEVMP